MWALDVFEIYRTALFLALTLYYAVIMAASGWHIAGLLRGDDPTRRLLRVYLGYQVVSIRLRTFTPELLQMAAWLAGLGLVYWAHARLG